jgi:hypothetical protein
MNSLPSENNKLLIVGWLLLRYICGLFLAGGSSLLVVLILLISIPTPSRVSVILTGVMAGLIGIVAGPITVPRHSRMFASAFYLALGVLYYVGVQHLIWWNRNEPGSTMFPLLFPLLVGGSLGVCLQVFLFIRERLKTRCKTSEC